MSLKPRDVETAEVLLSRKTRFELGEHAEEESTDRQKVDLGDYAFQAVELCLEALGPGGRAAAPAFYWAPPIVRPAGRRQVEDREAVDPDVKAVEEKHLRALGYIA